ncbi:hypothetical protein TanjilG_26315 [Lupinus angustifolius]|uniref:Uncharacterized protein n=1 Tax=Lupinus angustifolius TaxID=3871 RepID=A0A4P1R2F7_LUPAN|nr:hypothetical protein TanjilG_26315 [Lupinus angustifolius]
MDFWCSSLPMDDEFKELVIRMNNPRKFHHMLSRRSSSGIRKYHCTEIPPTDGHNPLK